MIFYIILGIVIIIDLIIVILLITSSIKLIKEINLGSYDARLVFERHEKEIKSKNKKHIFLRQFINITSNLLILIIGIMFLIGVVDSFVNVSNIKTFAVPTGSMSYKNEENTYLVENDLNNQIQINDLVFVKKINSLDDLKLYDIICYKDDTRKINIIHRVIEINDDYVKTKGDANSEIDLKNIYFDDIIGKYIDVRVPYIGGFVLFTSSNYGLLTFASVLLALLTYAISRNKVDGVEEKRLQYIDTYLVNTINEYAITSKYGYLEVNNNNFIYKEKEEENTDIFSSSILKINDKVIALSKGEKKDEK